MTRINFQPYRAEQLQEIVEARLASAKEGQPADAPDALHADALKLTAKRVSSISGDARRILDICRFVRVFLVSFHLLSPVLHIGEL